MSSNREHSHSPPNAPALKLLVLDSEDLAVVSANTQDAIVRVGDMAYLPRSKRFALVMCRFDWEGTHAGRCERRQAGLHFERVTGVAVSGIRQDQPETMLNLLSLTFEPGDAPSGSVRLIFSGGAVVRLEVECVEAEMHDLGPRWPARAVPGHPVGSEDQASETVARPPAGAADKGD
jgi:hypothetical protein